MRLGRELAGGETTSRQLVEQALARIADPAPAAAVEGVLRARG